jgi:hypothetical protein
VDILKKERVKTQKIKEITYVYIDKPYWDKTKKQNRHERDYIGKLGEDGRFIPNRKYLDRQNKAEGKNQETNAPVADRKFFGATHLMDCIGSKVGIAKDLKESFGEENANKIMSLVYFLVLESESSMYRFPKFAKTHKHPNGDVITSQRISDIFVGISENEKALFFKNRVKRCLKVASIIHNQETITEIKM